MRLEAALLFDDVGRWPPTRSGSAGPGDPRRVAQELVMVGYGIDNALATLPTAPRRRPRNCGVSGPRSPG
jgi:hypothetical protein